MTIYKVSLRTISESSEGFSYHSSFVNARKALNDWKAETGDNYVATEIVAIKFTPTKQGIIDLLNTHASHNDNG